MIFSLSQLNSKLFKQAKKKMSAITKLSKESQSFISELSLAGSRSLLISLAVGRAISDNLLMPSSPVDNINMYYIGQVKQTAANIIFQINELTILDTDMCESYVNKFFMYKYNSLYNSSNFIAINNETAIVDFFTISKYFDNETLNTISENAAKLTKYCNKLSKIKSELSA